MISSSIRLLAALLVVAPALSLAAQSTSPFDGKWVFNAEKSKFTTGPLPRKEVVTIANGTMTVQGESAKGRPFSFSLPLTPKNQPVPIAGRVELTVTTKETIHDLVQGWTDGSGTTYGIGELSADGSTLRYVLVGTRWNIPVHEESVFDRQQDSAQVGQNRPE